MAMTRAEYEALLSNPNIRKTLDVIAAAEGADYNVAFGGKRFTPGATHPGIRTYFTDKAGVRAPSSAAGRYQFVQGTWNGLQKQLGLPDFSPRSQDIGALALLDRRGALKDAAAGNWEALLNNKQIGQEWQAFMGTAPQASRSRQWLAKQFGLPGTSQAPAGSGGGGVAATLSAIDFPAAAPAQALPAVPLPGYLQGAKPSPAPAETGLLSLAELMRYADYQSPYSGPLGRYG